MSRRPDKAALAAKRNALRAQLAARKEQARKRLRKPPPRRNRWARRLGCLLLLLLLLLCCLIPDCSCTPREPGVATPAEPLPVEPVETEASIPAPTGRIQKRKRPPYRNEPARPLPWVASFRMQVAARSPRLSVCFEGAEAPGTLKWTTSVEPVDGTVSEHTLEPTLTSAELSAQERACVLAALTKPPYRLTPDAPEPTPSRLSMVIEF